MNTHPPASTQSMLRLNWWGADSAVYCSFYVRATEYTASYTPRRTAGLACNLLMADILTGALGRTHSKRNSTSLEPETSGS